MEIWFKTDKEAIRLPVLPSNVKLNNSSIISSVNILKLGEVPIYSGNNVQDGEISSFFPNKNYSFNEYLDIQKPFDLAMKFKEWSNIGQVVRFVVADNNNGTNINFRVRIVNFEYEQKDGTGDIYYSLKWKEVRDIKINKLSNSSNQNSNVNNNSKPNNSTEDKTQATQQKTYTVKKGDCLWDIAQKYYGKGSEYPKIQKANISKYPSLDKNPSYILPGWILVIP